MTKPHKPKLHYCRKHNTTSQGQCVACLSKSVARRENPLPEKWADEADSQLTPEHERLRQQMRKRSLEMLRTGNHVPIEDES